jgi:hypothetical protein
MNERIKSLLAQAHLEIKEEFGIIDTNQVAERFAELIVRECSDAVLSVPCYYKDYRSQIEEAVINDCGRAVLEHFGVKNGECETRK